MGRVSNLHWCTFKKSVGSVTQWFRQVPLDFISSLVNYVSWQKEDSFESRFDSFIWLFWFLTYISLGVPKQLQ